MNRKQQIALLQIDKEELENKLSAFELSDSDMIVINDKVRAIDTMLDEILDLNAIITKREAQSDITFDQVMLSRFISMKYIDKKNYEATLNGLSSFLFLLILFYRYSYFNGIKKH